jgi:predicted HTH domain antitoxin
MLQNFNIRYPESLPDALQMTPAQFESDAKMAMAVKLFELGKISSGVAAQLAGVDRVYFLLQLHNFGVNMIDLTNEELESDLANV